MCRQHSACVPVFSTTNHLIYTSNLNQCRPSSLNLSCKLFQSGRLSGVLRFAGTNRRVRAFVLFLILASSAGWAAAAVYGSRTLDGGEGSLHRSPFGVLDDLWANNLPIDTFTVEQLSFRWRALSFENLSATVSLSTSGKIKIFKLTECHIKKFVFLRNPPSKSILFENVTIKAKVAWDGEQNEVKIETCEVNLPTLGVLHCEGTFRTDREGGAGSIESPHLKAGRLLADLLALDEGFSLNFPLAARFDLSRPTPDQVHFEGKLSASGVKLQDKSFIYAGENLSPLLKIKGAWNLTQERGRVDASFSLRTGEVLIDKIYLDFAKTPLTLQLSLALDGLQKVNIASSQILLESIWSAQCKGSISNLLQMSGLDLDFFSPTQPIQSFWNKLIKDPLGEVHPALHGTNLNGQWGSRAHLEGSLARPKVRGWVGLEEVSVDYSGKPADAVVINCEFPFWFDSNPQASSDKPLNGRKGVIQLDNLKGSLLNLNSLTLLVEAQKNGWVLLNDVTLPLGKDQFKISEFELHDVWSPERTGQLVILADGLPLRPLLGRLLDTSLEATLTSPKLAFRLGNNRLESLDKIDLDVLSGSLRIESFAIDRLLSSGRVASLSASWNDVDLKRLTDLTDFGEITGRLKGVVDNLQISYGMPVAFDLMLESVPRPGVPQRISLAALENLTALGGGQSPFMGLAGGLITTFFKDFSYQKIGIRCILKNDFFTIRGLIEENGTEYLVKRGLTGVNVINQHTSNRISWNDMIRRLERINRTAEQGGAPTQGEEK